MGTILTLWGVCVPQLSRGAVRGWVCPSRKITLVSSSDVLGQVGERSLHENLHLGLKFQSKTVFCVDNRDRLARITSRTL